LSVKTSFEESEDRRLLGVTTGVKVDIVGDFIVDLELGKEDFMVCWECMFPFSHASPADIGYF
jgi:hypothetical protein